MRKLSVLLVTLGLVLIVFGASSVLKNNVSAAGAVITQPGTRCTRLTFEPKPKKNSLFGQKKKPDSGTAAETGIPGPGTRCTRLFSGGRPGTILPNAPPKVGLATSTAYISGNAEAQVKLKAIACDADNDTLLYTYTTTGGRITGDGAEAVWNLGNVTRPGTYTVSVEVNDGCGCVSYDSSSVTLE